MGPYLPLFDRRALGPVRWSVVVRSDRKPYVRRLQWRTLSVRTPMIPGVQGVTKEELPRGLRKNDGHTGLIPRP